MTRWWPGGLWCLCVACAGALDAATDDTDVADHTDVDTDDAETDLPVTDPVGLATTVVVWSDVLLPPGFAAGVFPLQVDEPLVLDATAIATTAVDQPQAGERRTLVWDLPEPGEDDLQSSLFGDARIAAYLVGLWVDEDGDGRHDEREPLVGAAEQLVVWVPEEADLASYGAAPGWNRLQLPRGVDEDFVFEPWRADDPALEVHTNLALVERGPLTLRVLPAVGPGPTSMALWDASEIRVRPVSREPTLMHFVATLDTPGTDVVLDAPLPTPPRDQWADGTFSRTEEPGNPFGRFGVVTSGVLYVALAFDDVNEDLRFTSDEPVYATSYTPQGGMAFYLVGRELTSGLFIEGAGVRPGWTLISTVIQGVPTVLPWDEGLELFVPPEE